MPLYDVGMTGLYLSMCTDMAQLATILGKDNDVRYLYQLGNTTAKAVNALMWSDNAGMYLNRMFSGNLSMHVSPFNLHPLLSGIASTEQAVTMATKWLMSSQGFCLAADGGGRSTGNPNCTYGLPSIAASDGAFGGDYWRGRTWGPMNYLVWKGLSHDAYANVPSVKTARVALANASQALLLKEWREHGHVHENYDPGTGEGDNRRNSNPFYTWGALLGYLALAEKGFL